MPILLSDTECPNCHEAYLVQQMYQNFCDCPMCGFLISAVELTQYNIINKEAKATPELDPGNEFYDLILE